MIRLIFKLLLLTSIISLFFCNNWLFLWIWVECITLCIIVLLRAYNNNIRNLESTSKYFVTQALASVVLLIGLLSRFYFDNTFKLIGKYSYLSYRLILLGLLIKLGVFPNPYWFIDVVRGVSYSRLIYIVVLSKVGPLYLLFVMADLDTFLITAFVGIITALVFALMGIKQPNLRKLVAFSSVATLGWFVVCLPLITRFRAIFCFLGYVFSVIPLIWVRRYLKFNNLFKAGRLYYKSSQKLALLLSLLSLGGLPPFVGFFIKWVFFQGLVDKSLFFIRSLLVIRSLFSLFFYLTSGFNVYSLFSLNRKKQAIFFFCRQDMARAQLIGLSLICLTGLLRFLGLILKLKVS